MGLYEKGKKETGDQELIVSSYVITRFSARCELVGVFSIHWEQCRRKGFPAKFVTKLERVLLSELETFARMGAVSCDQQAILPTSCSC